jgi:hypothetical protein
VRRWRNRCVGDDTAVAFADTSNALERNLKHYKTSSSEKVLFLRSLGEPKKLLLLGTVPSYFN